MPVISYKCPDCGGDLQFDPKSQKYKCEYCSGEFDQAALDKANPQAAQAQSQGAGAESQTAQAEQTEQRDENGAVVYSCPSCGAQIVTEETTAATFCYYCHNPVILQGKLSGEFTPDLIIPFGIDKKQATDSFLKYVRSKKFVPRDFFCKEQIEKISGVYFPFWMYSCKGEGTWRGSAQQINVYQRGDIEYTETKVFDVAREAQMTFDELTRDALNRENKELVEAVQPFRLDEAKEFSMGYLSGFQAEKRDIEKKDLLSDLHEEIENYAGQMLSASVSGYTMVQPNNVDMKVEAENWKYLLLPVWALTYKGGDDKTYYYAMNGQTGKVCGVLPLDKKRVVSLFFGIFFVLFVLLLLGGYFLW